MKKIKTIFFFLILFPVMSFAFSNDIKLISVNIPRTISVNHSITISGIIKNEGNIPIHEFRILYQLNSGPFVEDSVTGINIDTGSVYAFTHHVPLLMNGSPGSLDYISVSAYDPNGVPDQNIIDNTILSTTLITLGNFVAKNVLLETFTSTGCGYCPKERIIVENIIHNVPSANWVSIHGMFGIDSMRLPGAIQFESNFTIGEPATNIDRIKYDNALCIGLFETDSTQLQKVIAEKNMQSPCSLKLNLQIDTVARRMDATVDVNFTDYYFDGDYRLNLYLLEDSVSGIGQGYDQNSDYNNDPSSTLYGLGNPIVNYFHRNVLRSFVSGFWGVSGLIPASPQPGDHASYTFSQIAIDPHWRFGRIKLIAFVSKYSNNNYDHNDFRYEVLNSVSAIPSQELLSSVGVNHLDQNLISIYPNPTSDILNISFSEKTKNGVCEIYDATGRKMEDVKCNMENGKIDVSSFASGLYFIRIIDASNIYLKKFIKE